MPEITLAQAVRNAIEGEYYAARFYNMLARDNEDDRAARFFSKIADQEVHHAQQIEAMGDLMGASELPASPNIDVAGIGTVRSAEGRTDLTYGDALEIALQAERNAMRFYALMAELFEGDASLLFDTISRAEAEHAEDIETIMEHLEQTQARQILELPSQWLISADDEPTES
jgi:rubrerythrin